MLKIVSCCGYFQEDSSTVILTCGRNVVPYYLSKFFVMLAQNSQDLKKIPTRVRQCIHIVYMDEDDSLITCNMAMPSIDNNLKKYMSVKLFLINSL